MKYQILDHKADLKIKVFGKTKKELFENAMVGMFESAQYQPKLKSKEVKVKIKINSTNLSFLLIDFLNELLYLSETRKEVYQKINFNKLSKREIEAELIGKKLKRMGVHIKGATYHDLDIRRGKDKSWQATILFDI